MPASSTNSMSPPTTLIRHLPVMLLLLLLLVAGCTPATPTYTIADTTAVYSVTGRFETVGEIVAAAGVSLRPEDVVLPGAAAAADPATPIAIDRANEVSVLGVGGEQHYLTQAETLGEFLRETGLAPAPGERLLVDGRVIDAAFLQDAAALDALPLPARIVLDPYLTVTVRDGDTDHAVRLPGGTVAEALGQAGLSLGKFDTVEPPADMPLTPGLAITISRSDPVYIVVDGLMQESPAPAGVVTDVLAAAAVELGPLDYTSPPLEATVEPGGVIDVIRVSETIEAQEEPIPYETVYQADAAREIDNVVLLSGGSPGLLRRETRVRYENGIEVGRETTETVVTPPLNEVYAYGTNIVIRTVDTPEGPVEYWRVVNMKVVAYTPRSAGKKPGEPGYGITASGLPAGKGVVAVDPKVVPFRSQVYVPGYGVAIAGDTGGGVIGRIIDLGYDDDESYVPWRGRIDVYYLTPVPAADKIRYIIP